MMNASIFENQWPEIRSVVIKLLHQEPVTSIEWQDCFCLVHNLCSNGQEFAVKLKQALKTDMKDFIKNIKKKVMAHQEDQAFLKAYTTEWTKFFILSTYLPAPFKFLDLSFPNVIHSYYSNYDADEHCPIIHKLMLKNWNVIIFNDIKQKLIDLALKIVYSERNGEAYDPQLVITIRESFVNLFSIKQNKLKMYKTHFEQAYIDTTRSFYTTNALEYLELHGIRMYLRYADIKLREEIVRAQKYLEPYCGSVQLLTDCCIQVLLSNFHSTIFAEFADMMKNDDTETLSLLFKVIHFLPDGILEMLKKFEDYIVNSGLAIMMSSADTRDSEKYVEQLLLLFYKFSYLVQEAFNNNPKFLTARDKAYKQVVNDATVFKLELHTKQPESKCPELLANYCDMLLRKTPLSKKLTADEIESKLQGVLFVLKYVQNKDVFMRFHKAHFTRRLILEVSNDLDKEENMVDCLRKIGMPADCVNKLTRMFQDIIVSKGLNKQFKEIHRNMKGSIAESVNIKILNAGTWSQSCERVTVSLPMELEDYIPQIEEFYQEKHSGRKLIWYHHMSNGTISFSNDIGQFDIDVTTFQMAVLFIWNQRPRDKISFENLRLATELPDPELRRTLWSLVAFPRLKKQVVLTSTEIASPKDFNENTTFWINDDFSIIKNGKEQKRGKINLIGRLQLSTERSQKEESESIVQLRKFRVQEAIIKILKMRNQISNFNLQTELVDILKNMFLPSKIMIKEQVEWLIERQYIKRDEDDHSIFLYIA